MGEYVSFLRDIDLEDVGKAGGKGAILGHLLHSGFPVPPGFCVLGSAFQRVLPRDAIDEKLAGIDYEDSQSVEEAAKAIGKIFSSLVIPPDIKQEIVGAYGELVSGNGQLVAVRSSAATNDLAMKSFPGQMETYHNLKSAQQVLNKVKKCWASAFSYSSLVSRHARGIGHFDVFVAPIVELMVEATSAGVIFTENPLNGANEMVINSCFGLGEGVVSGSLQCDYFVVEKDSGKVLEEEIGDKKYKVVLNDKSGFGNRKMVLGAGEHKKVSISKRDIKRLVKVAKDIEDEMGCPQDIEWAFKNGSLYVLQSRAMVRPEGSSDGAMEEEAEWISEFDSTFDPAWPDYTLSNISEVLPEVLTPLSISDIGFLDYAFRKCNTDMGLMKGIHSKGEYTFIGIFYGRAHLNLSVYRKVIMKIPGATVKEFDRRAPEELAEDEQVAWHPSPAAILALPGIIGRTIYQAARAPKWATSVSDDFNRKMDRLRRLDYQNMPYNQVFAILADIWEDLHEVMTAHIATSQFSVSYYDILKQITASFLKDEDGILAARLVTGLQDVESAMPSIPIWDLSRVVEHSPELMEIFENNTPREIFELVREHDSPEARDFMTDLEAFLDRFGYRGVNEAEAMRPNWEQDPSYVMAMVRNHLDAGEELDPRRVATRQARERRQAVDEALASLKGLKLRLLLYFMKQTQLHIILRERVKAAIVKGLAHGKKVFRIVSLRLAEEGVLDSPDDIFFLAHKEIESLALGRSLSQPVRELVEKRRREYERNLRVVLPEYSRGRPRPLRPDELESMEGIELLEGIGVSPGTVTGRARVIKNPLDDAEIKPGEVLVAPVTDAAWTPLFVTASATVVDVGGPLSHGSIVAREFGIPCVVNVGKATQLVHTGQLITVDGSRGKVYLHPPEK